MKKRFNQRFALFMAILLVLSNLAFLQPQVVDAASLENAVTITALDEDGEEVLPLTAISIEEGDTAFDVLLQAGEKHDVEIAYDEYDFGNMVTGIGETTQSDPYFWSFNVNGLGPEVGASSYQVSNGEHLFFSLTDDFEPSITAKVSAIGKNGNEIIPETEVTLMRGASAYGALIQAAKKNNVQVDASIDDTYFTFINNVGETNLENGDYWSIAINDETLSASIVDHKIQPDEQLQLTIQTYEPPSEDEETPAEEDENADEKTPQPTITDALMQERIDGILSYMEKNNVTIEYGNEWWLWGLANTNQEVPASYVKSVKQKVKELDGNFGNIFDLEKVIIGLSAAGKDASSIEGQNLLDKLVNHTQLENPTVNMLIYALLAIDSGQYTVPDTFRNQLVQTILEYELEGGGWAFFGNEPTADITGMALSALAPYRDQENVKGAINRAIDYLSTEQDETGGYGTEVNGGDSSEAVSQVITGLSSVGVDPTGEDFTKMEGNLVQHLFKFKKDDGGFSHLKDDESSSVMATYQALLALNAYQKFVNQDGLVYQFPIKKEEDKETENPEDGNDNQDPDNPEDKHGNEEPKQDQKTEVKINPETTINSKKQEILVSVKLADTQNVEDNEIVVIEPNQARKQVVLTAAIDHGVLQRLVEKNNDLKIDKGDTQLLIPTKVLEQLLKESKDQKIEVKLVKQEVKRAVGSVYDFTFMAGTNEIQHFNNQEVTLTFEVNPALVAGLDPNKIKAFHFNEETNEWEIIENSTYDTDSGLVKAKTDHFSTYGVFENVQTENISAPVRAEVSETTNGNGEKLPDTATSTYNLLVLGIILLMCGVLFFIRSRKTQL
ncbi:DUF4430 domain-containing protein [Salinibacillus xinjiangensis]|uniref:DUF4430 domain-containing protein n=1 Tax=Salinibacillus xinjiangensis TaxID=1229268 RepID=A0A6G1X4G5_9BACI|nr:DUF4430 domain-containing protein [Salinibacillus xinjiangensis]MRG85770.1 DUF4430 domain-containing protein [Salinibacillus xinjiangensis]